MSINIITYQKEIKGLNIDESLNTKIIANENKLKALFKITNKKRQYHSTDHKPVNRERNNKKKMKRKISNNNYSDFDDNESKIQKNLIGFFSQKRNISINDIDLDNSSKKPKKIIEVNRKLKFLKNHSKKTTISNPNSNRKNQNIKNINNINYKRINPNKRKQKEEIYLNQKMNNNLNNSNNFCKDSSTIDYSVKSERCLSPSVKSLNVDQMIERFKRRESEKKEWVEEQMKKKEEEEKKFCSYAPKIDKNSKKINSKYKGDFFERQKTRDEERKKREEKLKITLNKKREEEINKTNYLLNKKFKAKKKENSLNNINSNSTILQRNKKLKTNNVINKLYEWEERRKEKIKEKRKINNENIEKINHIPTINKRSVSMAELKKQKYNDKNIFDRLSKNDRDSVEKKKLLAQLYTPSFQPMINTKKIKKKESNKSKNLKGDNNEENDKNIESRLISFSNQNIKDEEIQKLYRNVIFHNKKKV